MEFREEGSLPQTSRAEAYLRSKGWSISDHGDQMVVNPCPLCGNNKGKFYIAKGGEKDGLWNCFVCSEKGNLTELMKRLGDRDQRITSIQDWARSGQPPDPLPNIEACHRALLEDGEALDYLVAERGFSMAVIEKQRLGVASGVYFREAGVTKALVIPYFHKHATTFVKYRTLPPDKKDFSSPKGYEAGLYNEDVIVAGMDEILFVEGEADALACMSNGVPNVVGVPGANVQKAHWVTKLDRAAPKKIYLLYDTDEVGQKAAKEMAARIGIEKCFNIVLPEFTKDDGTAGKDINDWFRVGHTLEEFAELKSDARPFDVAGVCGVGDALRELEDEINQRGTLAPTYNTPWPSLNNKLGGGERGDVIVIMAKGKIGKTTLCLNWLDYYSQKGIPTLLYCQEMTPKRLARKWVSYVTRTDDSPEMSVNHPELMRAAIPAAKEIARSREGDMLFGYTVGHKPKEIFDTIRQAVRRYGVQVVCFDNLQLLSRSISNSAQELAVLSREFKSLAMELGILLLLIVQPKKLMRDQMVEAEDASGTGSVDKDCDAMVILSRRQNVLMSGRDFQQNGLIESDSTFEPQLGIKVGLNRYGPGGSLNLMMEGEISLVREQTDSERNFALPNPGGFQVEGNRPMEQA
jgi:5S rRNA maturation endonuclease (ribonuclease M5)/KaiC/GvpD/RAD55 family RecA-like ATPase